MAILARLWRRTARRRRRRAGDVAMIELVAGVVSGFIISYGAVEIFMARVHHSALRFCALAIISAVGVAIRVLSLEFFQALGDECRVCLCYILRRKPPVDLFSDDNLEENSSSGGRKIRPGPKQGKKAGGGGKNRKSANKVTSLSKERKSADEAEQAMLATELERLAEEAVAARGSAEGDDDFDDFVPVFRRSWSDSDLAAFRETWDTSEYDSFRMQSSTKCHAGDPGDEKLVSAVQDEKVVDDTPLMPVYGNEKVSVMPTFCAGPAAIPMLVPMYRGIWITEALDLMHAFEAAADETRPCALMFPPVDRSVYMNDQYHD